MSRWTLTAAAAGVLMAAGVVAAQQGTEREAPPPAPHCGTPAPDACRVASGDVDEATPVKTVAEMQRELRILRARHFGSMRNKEIRQIGITRLRQYTDPVIFPDLLEIFAREQEDVRTAVLDHLFDQKTDSADATIAWAAMFDKQEWFRDEATRRLQARTREAGEVTNRVQWSVAAGLKSGDETAIARAAELAADLHLFEAIPMLINLQVSGATRSSAGVGGGGREDGALAYILIGQQQAFVSDLQPVVGDNAVAFDPTLSVITSGTLLRVMGATVYTYRTEVHYSLRRLADAGWDGRSTASMGWDSQKWADWYVKEFLPYRAKVAAGQASAIKPRR